jgi:polyribonucleotide nucleotidyltransferase
MPEQASNHRGPRREREDRPERNDGPEPEFAPAFLTRDDD